MKVFDEKAIRRRGRKKTHHSKVYTFLAQNLKYIRDTWYTNK